jgi:hypothetical protein
VKDSMARPWPPLDNCRPADDTHAAAAAVTQDTPDLPGGSVQLAQRVPAVGGAHAAGAVHVPGRAAGQVAFSVSGQADCEGWQCPDEPAVGRSPALQPHSRTPVGLAGVVWVDGGQLKGVAMLLVGH